MPSRGAPCAGKQERPGGPSPRRTRPSANGGRADSRGPSGLSIPRCGMHRSNWTQHRRNARKKASKRLPHRSNAYDDDSGVRGEEQVRPLTNEQRATVEQNLGLVRWALSRNGNTLCRNADAVQDGCVALCQVAQRWQPKRSRFSNYAARRIVGAAHDGMRRWSRASPEARDGPPCKSREPPPESGLEAEDRCRRIREAMASLSPRDREALHRRFWMGQTDQEVGRELNVTYSRVSQIRKRALAILKQRLGSME